jgi:hypothetical protein
MLLDATTDKLEIILDKAITTSQLNFAVFYNDYISTGVTPTKNFGTTNSTTAVSLIPSPVSGHQHQLRWASISNTDTVDVGVKIRFNDNGLFRNMLYVFLMVGESIQYSEEMGWRVYTLNGEEKISGYNNLPPSVKYPSYMGYGSAASVSLLNTNCVCQYLGKAERPFSSINLQYKVTTALSGVVTWAELAIYKGSFSLGSGTVMTRLGFTDTSAVWNSATNKTTNILTPNMAIGDDLFVVFSNSVSVTQTAFRSGGIPETLSSGVYQTVANTRPSVSSSITGVVAFNVNTIIIAWQGIYQGT